MASPPSSSSAPLDQDSLEQLMSYMVKSMVNHPEEVSVLSDKDRNGFTFNLSVKADERGMVIGREGRYFKALESITEFAMRGNGSARLHLKE